MRRKLWIVLTAIVASLAMAFGISACSLTMNESTMTKEQLEAPVVTLSESGIASWEAVPHAMSYVYKVDEGEEVSVFTRYAQLEDGQTIVVKAKGNALRYSDSPYSVPVTYHATPVVSPDPEQLATPVVSVSEEGLATWEEVENASGYMYKLNGGAEQLFEGETLEYQLEDGQSISVMAKGDGKYYSDSDWSEAKLYTAPVVSQPTKLDTPEVTIDAEGIARWNAIENASAYFYKIDGGNETELEGEDLQVQLEKGQSISVMAKGDGERFTDSDWSEAKTYEGTMPEPQPLATPVISIDGEGLATWDPIPHASGYKYKINGEEAEHVFEGETLEYQLQDNEYIEVKAFSNDAEHYTDSGWGRSETYHKTPVIPTMLAKPVVALEGNIASWAKDPNAVRYEYVITEDGHDGEPVSTEGTSVELEDGQTIKVKAIGDGTNYSDSDWSNAVTYHETHTELTPLATPEVTIDEEGKATWPAVAGAKGYICKVNGEEKPEQEECEITLQSGDTLQVKAVPSDAEKNTESEYSELQTYTKQTEEKEGLLATFELGDDVEDVEGTGQNNDLRGDGNPSASNSITLKDTQEKYSISITDLSNVFEKAWDNAGNGCWKVGGSKEGYFTFVVPEGVEKVVIYVAGYKSNNVIVAYTIGTQSSGNITVTKHSATPEYEAIEITVTGTTEAERTLKFTTVKGGSSDPKPRCKINTIEFYGEPVTKLEKLATPEVKIDKDGNATWEAVPNASSYKYKVNNEEHTLEASAKLEVKLTDKQSITVQAVGDGETYSDSDWSAVKTYTAPVKLGTPEVSISDNGLATWAAVPNASGYKYKINDGDEQTLTGDKLQVQLNDKETITVQAIGDEEHFLSGDWSETKTYTAPKEITLDVPTVTISGDGKATWPAVANATAYKYKLSGDETEHELGADTLEVQLTDGQSIQVKAVGNGTNIHDSEYSASQEYIVKVTLTAPVVSLEGNVAKWDEVPNATAYLYKIDEQAEVRVEKSGPLQVTLTDGQSITVQAVGDDHKYLDSPWSDPVTYTAPVVKPNYGSEEAPLSVSEALALAEKECVNNGTFTKQIVTMTGKAKNTPKESSKGDYYESLYLVDDAGAEILVYSINLNSDVAAPVQNDIITIRGYITRYNGNDKTGEGTDGVIEFSSKKISSNNYENVYALKNERGQSTISVENDGGAIVTGLETGKGVNGQKVSFKVVPASGKRIESVTVYGEDLTADGEGNYEFVVNGNATVLIESLYEGQPSAQLLYTLTPNVKGSDNSYTSTNTIEVNEVQWSVEGNATMLPWRLGGKNISTAVDRTLKSVEAIEGKITKVILKFNSSTITVNSVTFKVFSSSEMSGEALYTQEIDYEDNTTITIKSSGWKDCFYELIFNVTNSSTSSNKYVEAPTIEFYGFEGEYIPTTPLASPTLNVNQNTGEVTWEKVDGATGYTYTVNGENEQTIDAEGERKVTLKNNDEISVIAKGDGTTHSDSAPATATYTHEHKHKSETLQHDANGHWYECVGCDEHLDPATHEYVEGVCSECQYAHPEEAHTYTKTPGVCDVCGKAHTDHKYSEEKPGECTVCHLKHTEHTYEDRNGKCHTCFAEHTGADHKVTTQKHDATNHWLECEVCGAKDGIAAHSHSTYGYNTNQHWSVCECGEKVPNTTVEHTKDHTYTEDPTEHWDVCVCGQEVPETRTAHTHDHYDIQEETHQSVCSCGAAFGEAASHSEKWANDANDHWQVCSDCGKELTKHTTHTYGEGEQHDHCTACGYNRTHVHEYEWTNDDTQHWEECKYCHEIKPGTEKQDHTYVNGVCSNENCQYHHEHTEYKKQGSDDTQHWNECEVCGAKDESSIETHTYEWKVSEEGSKHIHVCTCGHQDGEGHTPDMHYVTTDPSYHWQKCEEAGCTVTTENEKASHTFKCESISDEQHQEKCECGATHDPQNHTYKNGVCTNQECQHEHQNHNYDWVADEAGTTHNHQCTVCGNIDAHHEATPNTEAGLKHENGETHWYTCQGAKDCDLHVNETAHVGKPTEIEGDDENHKLVCECGKVTQKTVPHNYGTTYQQGESGHYQQCTQCEHKTAETPHDKAQENGLKCTCGKWDDEAIKDLLNGKFSAIENAITELSIDAYEEKKNEVKVDLGDARISMEIVEPSSQNVVSGAKAETGTEYTISFKLGSAKLTLTFKIRLTFSKGDEGEAITVDSSVITRELPRKLQLGTFTIDKDCIDKFVTDNKYKQYEWTSKDGTDDDANTIGGNLYAYPSGGMQFNYKGKDINGTETHKPFIYSNIATPGPITKVSIIVASSTAKDTRPWVLYVSENPYTDDTVQSGTNKGTKNAAKSDTDEEYTWTVDDSNAYYFSLFLDYTGGASILKKIEVTYKEVSDEAKLDAAIKSVGTIAPITEAQPEGLELPKAPEGITFTWSNAEEDEFYRVQDGKLIVGFLPAEEKTVKLTLEASIEGSDVAPKSQEFTVKVSKYDQWEEDAKAVLESIEIPSSLNVGETEISYTYIGNANVKLTLTSSLDGQEEKVSYAQPAENSGKITWTGGAVDDTLTLTFTATFTFPEGSADHGKEMTAPTKPFTITVVDPNKGPTEEEFDAVYDDVKKELNKIKDWTKAGNLPTTLDGHEGYTIKYVSGNGGALKIEEDGSYTVTQGDSDQSVTLTITITHTASDKSEQYEDYIVKMPAKVVEQSITATLKFKENFNSYNSDWGNGSYSEHTLQFSSLGVSNITGSVNLSSASHQSNTISDRPVIRANSDTQYVTITLTDEKKEISSISFALEAWGTDQFTSIQIEYNAGSEWKSCSQTSTNVPDTLSSTAKSIPSGVKEVRLTCSASGKKRLGLTSATIVVQTVGSSSSGGDTDTSAEDAKKVEAALATVEATLPEVTTVPYSKTFETSSNEVTFEWEVTEPKPLPSGMTFVDNSFSVTELPASKTTVKFEVTASYGKAEPQTKAVSVVVKAKPTQGGGDVGGEVTWTIVTAVGDLQYGDQIIIVATNSGKNYALGDLQNSNNRKAVEITLSGNTADISGAQVQIITLKEGKDGKDYSLYMSEYYDTSRTDANKQKGDFYLYGLTGTSNHMKTQTACDDNATWKITIENGQTSIVAQGSGTHKHLRFNPNSGSPIFSCYEQGKQTAVTIYKAVQS